MSSDLISRPNLNYGIRQSKAARRVVAWCAAVGLIAASPAVFYRHDIANFYDQRRLLFDIQDGCRQYMPPSSDAPFQSGLLDKGKRGQLWTESAPRCWTDLARAIQIPIDSDDPFLFLHEVTNSAGRPRIVAISMAAPWVDDTNHVYDGGAIISETNEQLPPDPHEYDDVVSIRVWVVDPATWRHDAAISTQRFDLRLKPSKSNSIRINYGKVFASAQSSVDLLIERTDGVEHWVGELGSDDVMRWKQQ